MLEQGEQDKPKVELEDVFDPSEIKARRLAAEDVVVQMADRPERHQFINSSLSDNPIPASELPFPLPELVAAFAVKRISKRTQYLFCSMHEDDSYPPYGSGLPPVARRSELYQQFHRAVVEALDCMFVKHYEVPYLWHYKQDLFALLEDGGRRAVQFLDRDELWSLYSLGVRFQGIFARVEEAKELFERIKEKRPAPPAQAAAPEPTYDENGDVKPVLDTPTTTDPYAAKDAYFQDKLLNSICLGSMEAAADAMHWLEYNYVTEVRHVREDEAMLADDGGEGKRRLPERTTIKDMRTGAIMELVKAFGIDVEHVAAAFSDADAKPAALADPTKMPLDLAEEYAGLDTPFSSAEQALHSESNATAAV
jgi:transcription elongation factor SPT6